MNLLQQVAESFNQWLTWLATGGSVMAASFILERISAFQNLSAGLKKFVSYLVASVIGVLALALVTFAPDFVLQAEPYFKFLAMIFGAIFLSNAFHKLDKPQG